MRGGGRGSGWSVGWDGAASSPSVVLCCVMMPRAAERRGAVWSVVLVVSSSLVAICIFAGASVNYGLYPMQAADNST